MKADNQYWSNYTSFQITKKRQIECRVAAGIKKQKDFFSFNLISREVHHNKVTNKQMFCVYQVSWSCSGKSIDSAGLAGGTVCSPVLQTTNPWVVINY